MTPNCLSHDKAIIGMVKTTPVWFICIVIDQAIIPNEARPNHVELRNLVVVGQQSLKSCFISGFSGLKWTNLELV